ncbi:hypothetical protein [Micromonospora sp. NPDC002717]|uniref:hypothetical protein n=1 Tax=Micromonospora sp. NPDC002717 TaxID=3154424 RepID=UPI00331BC72B
MPVRFTDAEARHQLTALGYSAVAGYPGSTKAWAAICVTCHEAVTVVLNRVKRDDRPRCRCRREKRAAAHQASGGLKVRNNADRAIGRMRTYDWEPLEPYPGARTRWSCRCLRCGTVGTPIMSGQDRARGCAGCSGRVGRITDEAAQQVMRQAGWIPTGPFPGPREPWECACATCGKIAKPRYETVKSNESGCKLCAAKENGKRRRERFESTAVGVMRAVNLEPQEPFPGANKRWRCQCLTCGSFTQPTYSNVSNGGGGCETCRRRKQGNSKRSRFAEEATERLRAAGYEPLVEYPGAAHPWRCRCRCGRDTTVRIGNVDAGQRGCRRCAVSGFNASKPAIVYLLHNAELQALKIGITQVGSTRVGRFRKLGWSVLVTEAFQDGMDALRVEDAILTWWRKDLGLPPYLAPGSTRDGGWTETIDAGSIGRALVLQRLRAEVANVRTRVSGNPRGGSSGTAAIPPQSLQVHMDAAKDSRDPERHLSIKESN